MADPVGFDFDASSVVGAPPAPFDFDTSEVVQAPPVELTPKARASMARLLASKGFVPTSVTLKPGDTDPSRYRAPPPAPAAPFDFDNSEVIRDVHPAEAFGRAAAASGIKSMTPIAELSDAAFGPAFQETNLERFRRERGMGGLPPTATDLLTSNIDREALQPNERYSGAGAEIAAGAGSVVGAAPMQAAELGLGGRAAGFALGAAAGYEERKRELLKAGVSDADATRAALASGTVEGAFQSLPMGVPGRLATRIGTGALAMGAAGPLSREAENLSLPQDRPELRQPVESWRSAAQDVLFGGAMHGAFGHRGEGAPDRAGAPPQRLAGSPDLARSDLPPVSDDEAQAAAQGEGVPTEAVPRDQLAAVVHLVQSDPEAASRILAQHANNTAAFLAAVTERNHANAEAANPAEPATGPTGADGAPGRATPPLAGAAGEREDPDSLAGEVGRSARAPGEVAPAGAAPGEAPRPPMPAPRAKQARPWINTDYDVPLAGGRDSPLRPDGTPKAPSERRTYIARNVPEWGWDPNSRQWVNHWEEIDDHEVAEEKHLDALGYGHRGDAHDEHGNPATESYLEQRGVDLKNYEAMLKPHIERARAIAESGRAILPPDLDMRVYEKPEFAELVRNNRRAAAPGEAFLDRDGNRYLDPVHGTLLSTIDTVAARREDGKGFAVLHAGSGKVLSTGRTLAKATAKAEAWALAKGRRALQRMLDAEPPQTQQQLRARFAPAPRDVRPAWRRRLEATPEEGDDLITFLRKRGGINVDAPAGGEIRGRLKHLNADDRRVGLAGIERSGTDMRTGRWKGLTLEQAAEAATEAGYIEAPPEGYGNYDQAALIDALYEAESGKKIFSRHADTGAYFERQTREAQAEQLARAQWESSIPPEAIDAAMERAELDEADRGDLALVAHAKQALGDDAVEQLSERHDSSDDAFYQALQEAIDAKRKAEEAAQGGGRLAQPFALDTHTEADLQRRQEAADRAEAEAVAASKRAEAPPPESFRLTGSARDADVGAAAGQRSLLEPESEYGKDPAAARNADRGHASVPVGSKPPVRGARVRASAITRSFDRHGAAALVGQRIGSPADLAAAAQIYRNPQYEVFRVFYLKDGSVVHATGVSARMPGRTPIFGPGVSVEDGIRGMRAEMARLGADQFYILHNHPSGDPTPSRSDLTTTRDIADQVPGFGGHVIVNSNRYAVVDADGSGAVFDQHYGEDRLVRAEKPSELLGRQIGSARDVASLGAQLKAPEGWTTILGDTSTQGLRAVVEVPTAGLMNEKRAPALLRRLARAMGTDRLFAYGPTSDMRNLRTLIQEGFLVDAVDEQGQGFRDTVPNEGKFFGKRPGATGAKFITEREREAADAAPAQDRGPGMPAGELEAAVQRMVGRGSRRFTVLGSESELPEDVRARAVPVADDRGAPEGFFDPQSNRNYLLADRIGDPRRAAWVVAHEGAHWGLHNLADSEPAFRATLQRARLNGQVRALAESIKAERLARGETIGNVQATAEALAELNAAARTGDWGHIGERYGVEVPASLKPKVLDAVGRYVRAAAAALNRLLRRALGRPPGAQAFTDAQVRDLIHSAWQRARSGAARAEGASGKPVFSRSGGRPGDPVLVDGKADLWNVPAELAAKTRGRFPAAPVRLLNGRHIDKNRGFGLVHIEAEHGAEIRALGMTVPEYVHHILSNATEAYDNGTGRLLIRAGKVPRGPAIIALDRDGDYYNVITAFERKPEGKLVWSGRRVALAQKGSEPPELRSDTATTQPSTDRSAQNAHRDVPAEQVSNPRSDALADQTSKAKDTPAGGDDQGNGVSYSRSPTARRGPAREGRAGADEGTEPRSRTPLGTAYDIHNKPLMLAVGRGSIRHAYAVLNRVSAAAERALRDSRATFDRMLATEQGREAIRRATDHWEQGREVLNPQLRPFFRSMKAAFDQRVEAIRAAGGELGYWHDYYPHLFKDPNTAQQWLQEYLGGHPLEGSKAFMRERVYETMAEARRAGLEPLSENPADMAQAHLRQMDKYIALHQIASDLEKRGLVIDDPGRYRLPPGYAKVSDPAFRGKLVPEVIAKDLNTTLGPTLYDQWWWRGFRKAENAMVSANLGFSAFHSTMTTLDTIAAHLGDAVQRAFIGDAGGALDSAGRALVSPILSPFAGTRLLKQSLGERLADAHTAALLRMLEQGGQQVFMSPTELNDSLVKMRRMVRQGEWLKAGAEAPLALLENITPLIHKYLVPAQKMTAKVLALKFELDRLAGQLTDAEGAPLRRGDYAGIEGALSEDAIRQIAGRVVQQVDERLGQMNYRNLFWNRTLRDALQGLFTSFGWQVGTLRTIGGGFLDVAHLARPPRILGALDREGRVQDAIYARLSSRTAYLVGLHGLLFGLNAGLTYALTGTGPQSIADLYTVRTGRKNPDGSDERLILPSYVKDEIEIAKHPIQMAINKLNPALHAIGDLARNRDYYGDEVYNPDDGMLTQAKQVGEYLAKTFLPYSVEGAVQGARVGRSPGIMAANLAGVNPAPAYMTRTPFAEFLAEKRALREIARTPEQEGQSGPYYDALSALRRGERPDLSMFSEGQQWQLLRSAEETPPELAFKSLPLLQKLDAWDKASDVERSEYRLQEHIFSNRVFNNLANLPDDQQAAAMIRLRQIEHWQPPRELAGAHG